MVTIFSALRSWSAYKHCHLVRDLLKNTLPIQFFQILFMKCRKFSGEFTGAIFLLTWTIPCARGVAKWPMNLKFWGLTEFLVHIIRQTWVRATFDSSACWSRTSKIGCFRQLKKSWMLFDALERGDFRTIKISLLRLDWATWICHWAWLGTLRKLTLKEYWYLYQMAS
jgi:hypothetical protein